MVQAVKDALAAADEEREWRKSKRRRRHAKENEDKAHSEKAKDKNTRKGPTSRSKGPTN